MIKIFVYRGWTVRQVGNTFSIWQHGIGWVFAATAKHEKRAREKFENFVEKQSKI